MEYTVNIFKRVKVTLVLLGYRGIDGAIGSGCSELGLLAGLVFVEEHGELHNIPRKCPRVDVFTKKKRDFHSCRTSALPSVASVVKNGNMCTVDRLLYSPSLSVAVDWSKYSGATLRIEILHGVSTDSTALPVFCV